jgi:hypothetical protein
MIAGLVRAGREDVDMTGDMVNRVGGAQVTGKKLCANETKTIFEPTLCLLVVELYAKIGLKTLR